MKFQFLIVTLQIELNIKLLLGTAKILVADAFGYYHTAGAVLDSGSQTSAITLSLTKRLGLNIHRSPFQVVGISSGAT